MSIKHNDSEKKPLQLVTWLLCLLLAFAIWIYVVNVTSEDYEKTYNLDIVLEGTDNLKNNMDMSVYDQTESRVSVTVKGLRSRLSEISESDFRAYIDVSSYTEEGKHEAQVKISVPEGLSVISYSPSSVDVYLDKIESKQVPVELSLSDYSIASGYEISSGSVDRDSVTVTGPATTLSRIEKALASVNLGSGWITSGFEHYAELKLISADGSAVESSFVSLDVSVVKVEFDVFLQKELSLTYSYASGFDSSCVSSVSIEPEFITVKGKAENVSRLASVNVLVIGPDTPSDCEIDISDLDLTDVISVLTKGKIRVHIEFKPEETEPVTSETAAETAAPETSPAETGTAETAEVPAESSAIAG